MDYMRKRVAALLSVKSIVTILTTIVFCYLTIVAFYFGTQTQKISDAVERNSGGEE